MKNILRILGISFLLVNLGISWVAAQNVAATLVDDFDGGDLPWWTYSDDGGSTFAAHLDNEVVYNGLASLRMDIELTAGGYAGGGFDFSFAQDWEAGYGIVMQVRASQEGMPLVLVLHLADETQTSPETPGVTPFGCDFTTPAGSEQDWVTVTLPWDCFVRLTWMGTAGITEFVAAPVVGFEIALDPADDQPLSGSVWVDDIRVLSDTDLNTVPNVSDVFDVLPVVHASQVGYRPDDPKQFVAIIAVENFSIVNDATGEEVFAGSADHWGFDEDSQREIYLGDFGSLTEVGTYRIVLDTGDESYPFNIGDDVYDAPLMLAARAFYLQRSGIDIQDTDISGVELEAGHLGLALLWDDREGETLDVSGGWYDAGDFGRFMPTAAFAVNQLLYGFSANPQYFIDHSLHIPESGNGVPDLLNEVRWELDWMLKMQRDDGAVHHKVTTRDFPGLGTLPVEDTEQLYVFAVSSADTAYFAAAMAHAAHIFAAYDADYAATLLDAAERAWDWLEQNPEQTPPGGFQNPPPSEYPMQGGYDFVGVESVPRLWAAAELFKATGDARYDAAFGELFATVTPEGKQTMTWANAYPMALYAYLTADQANSELLPLVAGVFQSQAETILDVTAMSGYGVALSDTVPSFGYVWGSNQVALAHGLYLMLANEVFPGSGYEEAALDQIQYVLGTNPLAKSYISGIGSDPVLHPHHNVSYHMQRAVPGFVTEGANNEDTGGDAVLQGVWDIGVPAALRYSDNWESWASNEPTLDANATFVALIAYWAH